MRRLAVIFLGLLATGASPDSVTNAAAPTARKEELIYRIDGVSAVMDSHRLVIHARGAVKSGGWTKPVLRVHLMMPAGQHTLVVEFMAEPPPPGAAVIQALLPMAASATESLGRRDIASVRVVSQTNDVTTQVLP